MKFESGCSVAEEMRKRPLPEPISRTTGWSLPKTSRRSSRTKPVSRGLMAMSSDGSSTARSLAQRLTGGRKAAPRPNESSSATKISVSCPSHYMMQSRSAPEPRSLDCRPYALEKLGITAQTRAHPTRKAQITFGVTAPFLSQLGDPTIGIAIEPAHEQMEAEQVRDRRSPAGRHSEDVLVALGGHEIGFRHL